MAPVSTIAPVQGSRWYTTSQVSTGTLGAQAGSEVTLAGSRFEKGMDMTDTPLEIATKSLDRMDRVVTDSLETGPGQVRTWPYPDSSEILAVFQDYVDLRQAVGDVVMDIEIGNKKPQSIALTLTQALEKGDLR